ncbi:MULTISPECIES: ribbon-helix-helix domain-containing protein [Haloferax]|uniref:Ribbon-helix-helix protein, copG family n=1 Tax=Haloferax massiliensis TaxID=1476858 RepID=A0A0D6JU66_9EURY|nr:MULTISPECIES: ribbon-helix-helix domain-containing protein [Haloferax]CQR51232.1 Ribbon-helix-helix protein, copG family [Haloferax massiliensis]
MALSVNVTISMPPEMVEKVDEQSKNHGMSRAEYVRHLIQQAPDSPFDEPDLRLTESPQVDA